MSLNTVIPQGPFESNGRKQLSLSSCGWVLIRSGQFKITLVAELGIQAIVTCVLDRDARPSRLAHSHLQLLFFSSTYGGDWSLSVVMALASLRFQRNAQDYEETRQGNDRFRWRCRLVLRVAISSSDQEVVMQGRRGSGSDGESR